MGYFDGIVSPDSASSYFPTLPGVPRITVRPSFETGAMRPPQDEGVEPPPGPGNAPRTAADASDERDTARPVRAGLFDDIVPPAASGDAGQTPADASDKPNTSPPARTAGLFDDIVPLAPQATGPVTTLTQAQIPQMDPMTGMPMPAPRLAPQSPGLPVRPETQAPLNTPPSGWPDLPVTAPRFGVPLAVPDPNARGEGFPTPPGPTAMDRIKAAAAHGFGDGPLGFSQENRAKYPNTFLRWQPLAAPLDFVRRAPGAAIGAVSSAGSEIYKALGGTETDANRLERDLNILGQIAMVEGGVGSRYNIGKPQANLFRTTDGAMSNEATAARGTIAATVSPAPLRQILAEASEQGVPNPRAGPQPPARPPDTAAAQSDRTNSGARESGPFDSSARPADVPTRRRGLPFGQDGEIVAPAPSRAQPLTREQKLPGDGLFADGDKQTDFIDAIKGVNHGALDALGRRTGVRATITQDMIDTGTKASSSIIPPGWSGDGNLFNEARGHLLGRQLGGSGDRAENLVTLQQKPANSPVMREFENQVRRAVESGQVVRYSSTPIYDGANLMPRGITLSARGSGGFDLDVTILNPAGR